MPPAPLWQVNLHDLHILNTETMAWTQPKCEGKVPQERRYHSASVIDTKVLIFGGQYYDATADLHFECDNAVCIYDAESNSWAALAVDASTPLRRACHAAGVVGKKVYLIGGRYWDVAEDDYIFLNDVQILDTQPASTLAKDWSVRCARISHAASLLAIRYSLSSLQSRDLLPYARRNAPLPCGRAGFHQQ